MVWWCGEFSRADETEMERMKLLESQACRAMDACSKKRARVLGHSSPAFEIAYKNVIME